MIDYDTPLTRIDWTPDLDMGQVMRANAMSIMNVEAADPRTRPILDELLGPPIGGWGLDMPYGAGGVSTCSMVALGLMRRAGIDCPDVCDGYADDIGSGMRVARNYARMLLPRPAWVTPITGMIPHVGDVIDLCGPSNHTETLIGWEFANDGTRLAVCIAGGQVGARGLQAIHRVKRPWTTRYARTYSGAREVYGWLDVALLGYRGQVTVPIGWEDA